MNRDQIQVSKISSEYPIKILPIRPEIDTK